MRTMVVMLWLLWSTWASAAVISIEFKFAPFTGDAKKVDMVQSVPGKARIFLNNVLLAEQNVKQQDLPVVIEDREVAPAVWIPAESLSLGLRKGKNMMRIEFQPTAANMSYTAQLRWESVTDQTTGGKQGGKSSTTKQTAAGGEEKQAQGTVVFEQEFIADFAMDLPWHHYPAVTTLSDADKQRIAALVQARVEAFQPNFGEFYKMLQGKPGIDLVDIRKNKCVDAAYNAGVRIAAAAPEQLAFTLTGHPEVVVQSKGGGDLYTADIQPFQRIKGDKIQMCANIALSVVYPSHFVVVRTPAGAWEVVY